MSTCSIALTDENHVHHRMVTKWYETTGRHDLGICAFTQAGFLRVTTNPKAVGIRLEKRWMFWKV